MRLNNIYLDKILEFAIDEDIGDGDHTSLACISKKSRGKSDLLVKESGILAGMDIAQKVFNKIDPGLQCEIYLHDGSSVEQGSIAFQVEGRILSILQSERLVLNFMQRLSGIATQTNLYAEKLKGLHTKILDTRKTTPGMRMLEKRAVELGGGSNHRMGLYDMILIKDNHIDFAGGVCQAIRKTLKYLQRTKKNLKVEVEVRNLDELTQVIHTGGVDRILLDNFSLTDTRQAVERINGMYETETSGNITLQNIREYAECGVDYISVGALTHHFRSLDMSMKAVDF